MSACSSRISLASLVFTLLLLRVICGPLQPPRRRTVRQVATPVPIQINPPTGEAAPITITAPGASPQTSPAPVSSPAPGTAAGISQGTTPITTPRTSPMPGIAPIGDDTPENATAETGTATGTVTGTVWDIVKSDAGEFDTNNGDYDMFTRAVTAANYNEVLTEAHGGIGVTLFAPTDAAFINTANSLGYQSSDETGAYNAIVQVLSNLTNGKPEDALFDIIGYHILPGSMNAQMLRERTPVKTYQGSQIVVDGFVLRHVATQLPDPQLVGGAASNRLADNGIMHGIDKLLFPFNVDLSLTSAIVNAAQKVGNQTDRNGGGGGSVCFPADALVLRADNTVVRMRDLVAGDEVKVVGRSTDENGHSSPVYLFTHRHFDGIHEFIQIATKGQEHMLSLSATHYLYANGQLTSADAVQVGDVIRTVSGPRLVESVTRVVDRGLIAPHTMHGDIVVGGVVASTYTALFPPQVAHALLAPVRAVAKAGIHHEPLGSLFYNGRPTVEITTVLRNVLRQMTLQLEVRSG